MWSIIGRKSKKWPEMTKNYVCASNPYLSKHTSYDPVFLLHKFKMMTSPNAFFISSKFCFSGLLGWRELKREKMAQNDKKLCLTSYLRNCTTCDYGFWYTFVKWWYLQQIFSYFFCLIFPVFQNSSINTKRKFWGVRHLPHMCKAMTYFVPVVVISSVKQGHLGQLLLATF